MNTHTTLDDLTIQFNHWRSTRGKSRRTPSRLIHSTLALLDDYPRHVVIKALGINSDTLKRWQKEIAHTSSDHPEFIELTTNEGVNKPLPESLDMSLQWGDITLSLSGTSHDLAGFVNQLTKGGAI